MTNDDKAAGELPEEARQLMIELGEQAEWDRIHAEAQRDGVYTGQRLRQLQPAKHKVICQLLAAGVGILRIAALVKVSHHTVVAIRDGSADAVAAEKRQISDQLRLAVRLLVERSIDEIEDIPLEKVPFFIGVMVDKMQLLDGQPTARLDTVASGGTTLEAFKRYIESLPRAEADGSQQPKGAVSDEHNLPVE